MIQIQTMNNTYNAIRDIERAIMPHPFDTPSEKTTYPRSCHKPITLNQLGPATDESKDTS